MGGWGDTFRLAASLMAGFIAAMAAGRVLAMVEAIKKATVAQAAFNVVARANPYVALAGAIAAVATAFFLFKGRSDDAKNAVQQLNDEINEFKNNTKSAKDNAERLKDAELRLEQAHIGVKQAIAERNRVQRLAAKGELSARQKSLQRQQTEVAVTSALRERERAEKDVADAQTGLALNTIKQVNTSTELEKELNKVTDSYERQAKVVEQDLGIGLDNLGDRFRATIDGFKDIAGKGKSATDVAKEYAKELRSIAQNADAAGLDVFAESVRKLAKEVQRTGEIKPKGFILPSFKFDAKPLKDFNKAADDFKKNTPKKFEAGSDAIGRAITNKLGASTKQAPKKVKSVVLQIPPAVSSVAPAAGAAGGEIGSAIRSGILAPLGSLSSDLSSRIAAAAASAKAAVMAAIGASSPSKLYGEIGASMGEGIIVEAKRSLQNLGKVLTNAVKKPIEEFGRKFKSAQLAINFIDTKRQAEDLRLAVVDAEKRLAEARKDNKADEIKAAERDLARAREDIVIASLQKMVDAEQRARDKISRSLDRQREKFDKVWSQFSSDALQAFDLITQHGLNQLTTKLDAARRKIETKFSGIFDSIELERGALTPAEQLIRDLEEGREAKRLSEAISDAQDELNAALKSKDKKRIADAQRRLEEATQDQQIAALRKQADIERAERDKLSEQRRRAAEEERDRAITALEEQTNRERIEFEARREQERRAFEADLLRLETALKNKRGAHKNAHAKLLKLLGKHNVDLEISGFEGGQAFADGLTRAIPQVAKAGKAIAAELAKYVKLKSPAEKGPLSDLDQWWRPFVSTLLSGLDTRAINAAIGNVASPVLGVGGGAGGIVEVHSHIHLDGRQIAEVVTRQQNRFGLHNPSIFGGRA
jgi:hypothetical protein